MALWGPLVLIRYVALCRQDYMYVSKGEPLTWNYEPSGLHLITSLYNCCPYTFPPNIVVGLCTLQANVLGSLEVRFSLVWHVGAGRVCILLVARSSTTFLSPGRLYPLERTLLAGVWVNLSL